MDTVKIDKEHHPACFELYLDFFNIKGRLKSKVHTIFIYLTRNNLIECPFELYDKEGHSILQEKECEN